jgi:hypothetical protein
MEKYVIGYRGFDILIYLENSGQWRWRHSVKETTIRYEGWNETEYRALEDAFWSVDDYIHDFEIV